MKLNVDKMQKLFDHRRTLQMIWLNVKEISNTCTRLKNVRVIYWKTSHSLSCLYALHPSSSPLSVISFTIYTIYYILLKDLFMEIQSVCVYSLSYIKHALLYPLLYGHFPGPFQWILSLRFLCWSFEMFSGNTRIGHSAPNFKVTAIMPDG